MPQYFIESTQVNGLFLFWIYILGYLVITISLVLVILNVNSTGSEKFADLNLFHALGNNQFIKLLFTTILLSLAGLPPFYFFVFKVGLLSLVLKTQSWALFVSVVFVLLLSWYAYHAALIKLLQTKKNTTHNTKPTTTVFSALILPLLFFFFVFGVFIADDFFFVGYMFL